MTWFRFWLLLHIFVAIAAFGPTFSLGLVASYARKDPKNAHLATEIAHAIETKITIPAAVVQPFLGLALIYSAFPALEEHVARDRDHPVYDHVLLRGPRAEP